jgi:hypothetical protein
VKNIEFPKLSYARECVSVFWYGKEINCSEFDVFSGS